MQTQAITGYVKLNEAAQNPGIASPPVMCLLLEDSRFDRRRIQHTAERAGVRLEIVEAATIAEARVALDTHDFNLLIFDYVLPDGDGIALAREVAADPKYSKVPILILTGNDSDGVALEAVAAGCADYLTKDALNPESFQRALRRAWRGKQGDEEPASDSGDAPSSIRDALDRFATACIGELKAPMAQMLRNVHALSGSSDLSALDRHSVDDLAEGCENLWAYLEEIQRFAREYKD